MFGVPLHWDALMHMSSSQKRAVGGHVQPGLQTLGHCGFGFAHVGKQRRLPQQRLKIRPPVHSEHANTAQLTTVGHRAFQVAETIYRIMSRLVCIVPSTSFLAVIQRLTFPAGPFPDFL